MICHPRSWRGVFRRRSCRRSGEWRPAAAARNRGLGRSGTPTGYVVITTLFEFFSVQPPARARRDLPERPPVRTTQGKSVMSTAPRQPHVGQRGPEGWLDDRAPASQAPTMAPKRSLAELRAPRSAELGSACPQLFCDGDHIAPDTFVRMSPCGRLNLRGWPMIALGKTAVLTSMILGACFNPLAAQETSRDVAFVETVTGRVIAFASGTRRYSAR